MRRAAALLLGLGLALVAAAAAAPPGSDALLAVYFVAGVFSLAAVFGGVRLHRPPPSAIWTLARATIAAFFVSGTVEALGTGTVLPHGSLWSLASLPAYALGAASVVALVRSAGPTRLAFSDAALGTLASIALLWAIAIEPNLAGFPHPGHVAALVFAVADLVLLALLLRLVFSAVGRVRSFAFLGSALLALLVADVAGQTPHVGDTPPQRLIAACYAAAYVLVGLAALDPSMRELVTARSDEQDPSPRRTLAVVGLAMLAVPAGLGVNELVEGETDSLVYALLGSTIAVLVARKLGHVLRTLDSQRRRAEESERRFRSVFSSAGLGISLGKDGMMTETNPALQRMLGYGPQELARLHYRDLTHPDDVALELEAESRVMSGIEPTHSFEKRYVRKDGTVFDAEVTLSLADDASFGIALIEDVTARHALEEELRRAQKMDAIGKLAGGIAHDFNNLLTVVRGYADFLAQECEGDDPRTEAVEEIARAATRAADLTRQLLAFSRRQVLRPEPTDLAETVGEMETLLRRLLPENVSLVLDTQPGALAQVDRAQLDQVVLNLVVNARDAMPAGGTLTIRTRAAGRFAEIAVEDEGEGMDEETRTRIFEPFFTTKPVGSGTGLGLSTVEGIVDQSGGEIAVESVPGGGSVFTVRLPLAAARAALSEPIRRIAGAAPAAGVVLLVEDEAPVRAVAAGMLERGGYAVVAAADGEEALERLEEGLVPDVLVSDVVMTGIGGPELARRARARVPGLPVLFISGYAADALLRDEQELGAALLAKPFSADDLLAAVALTRRGVEVHAAS